MSTFPKSRRADCRLECRFARPLQLLRASAQQCLLLCLVVSLNSYQSVHAVETTALWLFDEPRGTYPSSVLDSSLGHDYPLVLGQGGQIVAGKYGNALATIRQPRVIYPNGEPLYGLQRPWKIFASDRQRMTWQNSHFAAIMADGERHLRKEVGFVNAVESKLNLGDFDWTVEFWLKASESADEAGTVFELGFSPGAKLDMKTRLALTAARREFILINTPSQTELKIRTNESALRDEAWHHFAFVYSVAENQMSHYVDGQKQPDSSSCQLESLPRKPNSYLSLGRSGAGRHPLPGQMDELRFSTGQVYLESFQPPASLATVPPPLVLEAGASLLFDKSGSPDSPIALGSRRYLFIDDALLAEVQGADFVVNPPKRAERVIDNILGPFRKHLTVVDDPAGLIRIYNSVKADQLA
ncbi:MAG: LamG domain-containing protein, partial [Bythopirellula sp.]